MSEQKHELAPTIELMTARQVATELVVRALFQTHPNKAEAMTYLERILGHALTQPHYVLNPQQSAQVKGTVAWLTEPGPAESPED